MVPCLPFIELMNNNTLQRLPQVCLIRRALEWDLGCVIIQQRMRSRLAEMVDSDEFVPVLLFNVIFAGSRTSASGYVFG